MNYEHIENLVTKAKLGDTKAKEMLAEVFTPFIINLSKKTFINSYEFSDVKNECFKTLFKCLSLYNPDRHRFAAYATTAIKNSVNHLIRTSVRRVGSEGPGAFILDGNLSDILFTDVNEHNDDIINGIDKERLRAALKKLNFSEQELINYIYYKGLSLKKYSESKGIRYSTAFSRKAGILKKLKKDFSMPVHNENKLN